jgi:hypothetical protein
MAETILYTDDNDVVVTDSTLRVRKRFYRLDKIARHNISIIKPNRGIGFFLLGSGLLMVIAGLSGRSWQPDVFIHIASLTLQKNIVFVIGGSMLMLGGIIFLIIMKEKYGVRIVTDNGEKDVVVSHRREYIVRIEEALNKASFNMLDKKDRKDMEASLRMSRESSTTPSIKP